MSTDTAPVLFLLGPTASGKTEAAIELAAHLPVDIISVDSAMVYKTMDIGTAKPTAEELAAAPHALIDVVDPAQAWSVGDFLELAMAQIHQSFDNNRMPVLVGGTMMYFRALEYGLAELPQAIEELRAEIDALAEARGWSYIHQELDKVDPVSAARIHPNDAQRLQRALEVYRISGKPLSHWHQHHNSRFPYPLVKIALVHEDRKLLHERISLRFDRMMANGFLEEVERLYARGDLDENMPSMRCVGYRQLWQHLQGKADLNQACERAQTVTRQLAKRQMTWIRSDQNLHQISCVNAGQNAGQNSGQNSGKNCSLYRAITEKWINY